MRISSAGVPALFIAALTALTLACDQSGGGHRAAAEELLVFTGAEENSMVGASAMADVMVQGNPNFAPYRDVLLVWAEQVMTWENMEPRLVDLYVEVFAEDELRRLVDFYGTPLGTKVLEATPEIARRSALIGGAMAQEHLPELQQMIKARTAELQQPEAPR